jgi:Putative viral replication protein
MDFSGLSDLEVDAPDGDIDDPEFIIDYLLGVRGRRQRGMSRAKNWCFTLNNYTDQDVDRIMSLESDVDYLIIGKEVGESGTPHLQGFVSFKSRVRRTTAIQRIGQAHFTVCRNIENSVNYCKKDGDFMELGELPRGSGCRSDLELFKAAVCDGEHDMCRLRDAFSEVVAKYPKFCNDYVNDKLPRKVVDAHPLFEWQQQLYHDICLPADDRKIVFCVDHVGNSGKSWFCHYVCGIKENCQVLLPGKKADMAYSLSPLVKILFVDAPRSKQGEYIQYDFLEDVKNGYVFCPKYESRVKHLGKVHVVVMMNEAPDMTKLSPDRYDIRYVSRPV